MSFGQEDILSPNNRPRWSPVSGGAELAVPFSGICSVHILIQPPARPDWVFAGTGWLCSRRTVVTAAHVVDIRAVQSTLGRRIDRWNIRLCFGPRPHNGPFTSCVPIKALLTFDPNVYAGSDWANLAGAPNDLAVLRLASPMAPPFEPLLVDTAPPSLAGSRLRIAGFPGRTRGQQLFVHDGLVMAAEQHLVFYDIDTENGQSGAPLLTGAPGHEGVIGIHVFGRNLGHTPTARRFNAGLPFTPQMLEWLRQVAT